MDSQLEMSIRIDEMLRENVINTSFFKALSAHGKNKFLAKKRLEYAAVLRQKDIWVEEVAIEILEEEQRKKTFDDILIKRFSDQEYFCSYRDVDNGGAPQSCWAQEG